MVEWSGFPEKDRSVENKDGPHTIAQFTWKLLKHRKQKSSQFLLSQYSTKVRVTPRCNSTSHSHYSTELKTKSVQAFYNTIIVVNHIYIQLYGEVLMELTDVTLLTEHCNWLLMDEFFVLRFMRC